MSETLSKLDVQKMKALVRTPNGVVCMERAVPRLQSPTDVRIKVQSTAICRTDVFAANGTIPVEDGRVLGHEFAGTVDQVGSSVTSIKLGSRVAVNPLISCGRCQACGDGAHHYCAETQFIGIDLDGAFAQWIVVPEYQVYQLPESVRFDVGAYAEPLAAVMAILEAELPHEEPIAVTGDGRIADLTCIILKDHDYQVVRVNVGQAEKNGFAAVVETDLNSANAEGILKLLKPGGLLVMKSRRPEEISLSPLLCIKRRLRIQAVHYAPFENALEYLERSKDQLQTFIGQTYPLEAHEQAFTASCANEKVKIYFNPND